VLENNTRARISAAAKQEGHLEQGTDFATQLAKVVAGTAHRQQIGGGPSQGSSVEQELPRHDWATSLGQASADGDPDQRRHQAVDEAAGLPGWIFQGLEQDQVREQEQIEGEHRSQAEGEEPDPLTPLRWRIPIDLFDQHQAGDGHQ
jgi:hypothetical protein